MAEYTDHAFLGVQRGAADMVNILDQLTKWKSENIATAGELYKAAVAARQAGDDMTAESYEDNASRMMSVGSHLKNGFNYMNSSPFTLPTMSPWDLEAQAKNDYLREKTAFEKADYEKEMAKASRLRNQMTSKQMVRNQYASGTPEWTKYNNDLNDLTNQWNAANSGAGDAYRRYEMKSEDALINWKKP